MGAALILVGAISSAPDVSQARQEQTTWLNQKIEDSQEIRSVLAKKLPSPEPLPLITARASHAPQPAAAVASSSSVALQRNLAQARDAFANVEPAFADTHVRAYGEFDRHAIQ